MAAQAEFSRVESGISHRHPNTLKELNWDQKINRIVILTKYIIFRN